MNINKLIEHWKALSSLIRGAQNIEEFDVLH